MSVPANIAEGVGRGAPREAARFGQIALGSIYELQTLVIISKELGYTEMGDADEVRNRLTSIARRLSAFIKYNEAKALAK